MDKKIKYLLGFGIPVILLAGFFIGMYLRPTRIVVEKDPTKSEPYLKLQKSFDSLGYYVNDLKRSNMILLLEKDSFKNEFRILEGKELKTREYYETLRTYIASWDSTDINLYFSNRPAQEN